MPYRDFTEAQEEGKTLDFTLGYKGRERDFSIENDVPSNVMMSIIADGLDPDNLTDQQAMLLGVRVLRNMVGEEDWEWILNNTGRTQLQAFMQWFIEHVFPDNKEKEGEAEEGKESFPAKPETPSPSPSNISSIIGPPSNSIVRNFGIVDPRKSDSVASGD